jgi:hypothetical protein
MPRTVVTRVPLDTCGNPLPAAAARPTTGASDPAAGAAAAPSLSPAEAATLRKPYTAEKPITGQGESGWSKAQGLQHVDPRQGSDASRAGSGAAADATPGPAAAANVVEPIPAPASKKDAPAASRPAEKEPTIAPPGVEVFPPAPASDTRDLPAAKTSGRPWLPPTAPDRGHTT